MLHREFNIQIWILQPGIISDFPGFRTAIPFALHHLPVCFGGIYLKKTPTSNNRKDSNTVPATFLLAEQGRRQLSPAVPTSLALWASQHFLPLSSVFVLGVLFQFLSLWLMLPERQGTSVVSLKCLLKTGAHPRGGFQGPCKPLKAHTACVFCRRGRLQLALLNLPLGTGLPASDGEVLGAKHVIFILLLCQRCSGIWPWRSRRA